MNIQKIQTQLLEGNGRIETGPLQINDDWPGTFIRGDNSIYYATMLEQLLSNVKDQPFHVVVLNGLVRELKHCYE